MTGFKLPNYKIAKFTKCFPLTNIFAKPKSPTAISAPGRCWACAWPCWGSRNWASKTRAAKDRKRLVTFVEIDRCATDAISLVTGCRLGKRALKFRDWGKMAATFVDVSTRARPSEAWTGHPAIRIAAKESSKALARAMHPEIESKNQQQMLAYREMPEDDLFTKQWVKVELPAEEFPGYKGERIVCAECGEGINFRREVVRDGRVLCRACSGERYYEACKLSGSADIPAVQAKLGWGTLQFFL